MYNFILSLYFKHNGISSTKKNCIFLNKCINHNINVSNKYFEMVEDFEYVGKYPNKS